MKTFRPYPIPGTFRAVVFLTRKFAIKFEAQSNFVSEMPPVRIMGTDCVDVF